MKRSIHSFFPTPIGNSVLLLFVVALVFAACSAPNKQIKEDDKSAKPTWVDNPQVLYPEGMYLAAVGIGSTREAANSFAIGNIAKIFKVEVKASSEVIQRYMEFTAGNQTSTAGMTTSDQNVRVDTEANLFNIKIGQNWVDELGRHYTLAYQDRQQTAQIMEQRITDNTQRILTNLKKALKEGDPWMQFALIDNAAMISLLNSEMLEQLGIISPSTRSGIQLGYDPEVLRLQRADAAKKLIFAVDVNGDPDNKIKPVIEQTISQMGFSLRGENPNKIDAVVSFEDVVLDQPQKFTRYSLALNVLDHNGKKVLTIADSGREGHINQPEAKARAIRTVNAKITNEMPKKVWAYIDTLAKK